MTTTELHAKRHRKEMVRRSLRLARRRSRWALEEAQRRFDPVAYENQLRAKREEQQAAQKRVADLAARLEKKSGGVSVLRRIWNRVTGAK